MARATGSLVRAMVAAMQRAGQHRKYSDSEVQKLVEESGYWRDSDAETPKRTVNKNLNTWPYYFEKCGKNQFRLQPKLLTPTKIPLPIDQEEYVENDKFEYEDEDEYEHKLEEDKPADKTKVKTSRRIRDTRLIRQLKQVHQDRCQICKTVLKLPDFMYSEGHHIMPLNKEGPDIAGNILILCPNCHVQCDYGAISLSLDDLRTDSRHKIDPKYIEWHNQCFSK